MSNVSSSLVFAEYVARNTSLKAANDEGTITRVARLNAWVFLLLWLCATNVWWRSLTRKNLSKYRNALSKHLPPAMQQILSTIDNVLLRLKNSEFLLMMGRENWNEDVFNNLLPDRANVEHMSSTNKDYLPVSVRWVKKNMSVKIGADYKCYVG